MSARAAAPLLAAALAVAVGGIARGQGSSRLETPGSLSDRYLTAPEVRDALHRAVPQFDACFFEHVGAELPGDITLRFVVARDGGPVDIELDMDESFGDLRDCLTTLVGELEFDAHDGDPLAVAYPLVFVRDDRGSRTIPYPIVFVRPRARDFLLIPVPPSLDATEREQLERLLYPTVPTRGR